MKQATEPGNAAGAEWSIGSITCCVVVFLLSPLLLSQHRQPGDVVQFAGIDMVYIPAGSFPMGAADGESDEKPVHKVSLNAFYMGTREIRQQQWEAIMGENKSEFASPAMPIMQVSWYEAARFCNRLSDKAGFQRCYDENTWQCDFSRSGFRLPTEAEWEYAAKAGGQPDLQREEFKAGRQNERDYLGLNKIANAYGVYDMFGTEWEWCNDWYDAAYYGSSPDRNPAGPTDGELRVIRGAGWYLYATFCRACDRNQIYPYQRSYNLSMRVVRSAP